MENLVLDQPRSHVRIHTFAEGLLARLAHDLALECRSLRGAAARSAPGSGTATVDVPVAGIVILGVLEGERIDEHVLSPSDRRDALAKMRREVFHAESDPDATVHVEAALEGGAARLHLGFPNGRRVTLAARPTLTETADGLRVSGSVPLSLASAGSDPVKGPMGAFRMKDRVEVRFDAWFVKADLDPPAG